MSIEISSPLLWQLTRKLMKLYNILHVLNGKRAYVCYLQGAGGALILYRYSVSVSLQCLFSQLI